MAVDLGSSVSNPSLILLNSRSLLFPGSKRSNFIRGSRGDDDESSDSADEETIAVIPLMEGGTKAPVMPAPPADAGALGQEASATADATASPPETLTD
ncbi:uncharacterized protein A4U43_C07F27290 [Asparagus officinalis]|uniref:Uncharacterized protein n=1 Tax=Asparagus officinalis TaxID=4686 RepID=A0A5P1EFL1_ASPOF|nr:uncharacterized protein A4U43_C07F27290 [Asparagus officinalis]